MEIKVNDLKKVFDDNVILNEVNLTLKSGNIYGFIGKNGSGKSVLFKIICGFYEPTNGNVIIDGVDIHKTKTFLPNARVLIEKPNFLPNISGYENLKLLAKIQNKISDKEIKESLNLVNLSEAEYNKKYHKYSLGMKQKLGIAQVIMEAPDIMIFDEPFSGIENASVAQIKNYFKEINHKNKIILFASHNQEEIAELCDEVYMLDGGNCTKIR